MIVGINFTGVREHYALLEDLRRAIRLPKFHGGGKRGPRTRLQGLASTEEEAKDMVSQADNGRRVFYVQFKRTTRFGSVWAIYVS
jgi:hypothetical protein